MLVFLVLITGGIAWKYFSANDANKIESIAVLPLKNLNENEDENPLSLGLTDNLISRLGSLNHFTVLPLSAVTRFEDSGKDAVQFGKDLKVNAVLTGTIQKVDGTTSHKYPLDQMFKTVHKFGKELLMKTKATSSNCRMIYQRKFWNP